MIELENFKCNWSADFLKLVKESPIFRVFIPDFNENLDCSTCKKPVTSKKDVAVHYGMYFCHLDCVKTIYCSYCKKGCNVDTFQGSLDKNYGFMCQQCKDSLKECVFCKTPSLPSILIDEHCPNCRVPCRNCNKSTGKSKLYKIKGMNLYCWTCAQRDIWVKSHDFNPLSVLKFQGNPKNGLYLGVELELECEDELKAIKMAESVNKNFGKHIVVKHDGSLAPQDQGSHKRGRHGMEIVTAPGDMEFHQGLWKKFFDKGYVFDSEKSIRCSTHVHMSKQGLREMQLARMAYFMYAPTNRQFIHLIAGRRLDNEWGEKYSRISPKISILDIVEVYGSRSYWQRQTGNQDKETLDVLELPSYSRQIKYKHGYIKASGGLSAEPGHAGKFDRYTALNVQNDNTAEMRIFCGTNSYEVMMKNLEFCLALVSYCDIGRTAYSDLAKTENFIKYLKEYRSCYPNLISYLTKKKHPDFPKKKSVKQVELNLKTENNSVCNIV